MAPISIDVVDKIFRFFDGGNNLLQRAEDDHNHGAGDDKESCTGNCVRNWKIIFAVLLFIEGLVFGHLVLLIRRKTINSQKTFTMITRYGNALSAGVFLSTGLLHILPEALEIFSGGGHHAEEDSHAGHFLVTGRADDDDDHDHDHEGHDHDDDDHDKDEGHDDHDHGDKDNQSGADDHSGHGDHEIKFPWVMFSVIIGFYAMFLLEKIIIPRLFGSAHNHNAVPTSEEPTSPATATTTNEDDSAVDNEKENAPVELIGGLTSRAFIIAMLQILGISAHSLFESMTLGLSSKFSTVLNVFIATASHRWATCLAIGFTCASKLSYLPFLVVFLVFSAMVPLGIGIGAALTGMNNTLEGILFALSAATFLYIGAFETMSEEFVEDKQHTIKKFLVTLGGAGIIIVITAILVVNDIHG